MGTLLTARLRGRPRFNVQLPLAAALNRIIITPKSQVPNKLAKRYFCVVVFMALDACHRCRITPSSAQQHQHNGEPAGAARGLTCGWHPPNPKAQRCPGHPQSVVPSKECSAGAVPCTPAPGLLLARIFNALTILPPACCPEGLVAAQTSFPESFSRIPSDLQCFEPSDVF